MKFPAYFTCVSLALCLMCGCTSVSRSNTARTATEQLLIANAIDQSLNKVDFQAFQGQKVFLDDKYLESVDKGYLIGSIRHRLMRQGAVITGKAEDADVVLEIRSGAIGTDTAESFIGMPEITLPGMMTLPEIRLFTRSRQIGTAKIGIVAYDNQSKHVLGDGGVAMARSDDNNWFVMGIGPMQNGSLHKEVNHSAAATPPHAKQQQLPTQIAFQQPSRVNIPQQQPVSTPRQKFKLTAGEQPKQKTVPAAEYFKTEELFPDEQQALFPDERKPAIVPFKPQANPSTDEKAESLFP